MAFDNSSEKVCSHAAFYIAICAMCCVCYYNSCQCDFVFDDISAVRDNRDLRPHVPLANLFRNDFWGTPMQKEQSHKSYRPLCVLTFRANYYFHQLNPFGYHLVNIVLHTIVSMLLFKMCSMFLSEMSSFIAGLLFSVHPVHTEAVTGVVGRAETLSSIFFLMAVILYSEAAKKRKKTDWRYLTLSVASIATAMLCKEQGITVAGVCVLYELFVIQKYGMKDILAVMKASPLAKNELPTWPVEATKRLAFLMVSTLGLLVIRVQVMGAKLPVFTRFDNPASVADTLPRYLTYNYLLAVNAWILLFPCDLCCDWTMGTIPLVTSAADTRNFATLAFYFVLFALAYAAAVTKNKEQSNNLIVGLGLIVMPFLPASNLFFPVGFVVAERVLYMPSMGFCMLVAYGFGLIVEKWNKKIGWLLMCLLLLFHGVKTYRRNFDWINEYTIFTAGLKVNQRNAKLFNNVGHSLENQGIHEEALKYFKTAVQVQPDDVGAHMNVGRTYNHLKLYKEAEEAYLKAKSLLPTAKPGKSYKTRIAPSHLNVFLNLANLISKNASRLQEADNLYKQAISMRADYTQAYINRGDILIKLNKTKEAQEVYERALLYDSTNADIYYNLGVVHLEQGKAPQALAYLDKALEYDPDHQQALLNSAIVLQEFGQEQYRVTAEQRLFKLLEKDSNNEKVYFNLGMLAMDRKNHTLAEMWFRKAVSLKEDFRSALFNLALLLADENQPLVAVPFLKQLVRHHPNHIKGLILLGDIYINNLKDLDAAEKCYKEIIALEGNNVQALHNLCVVHVERGNFLAAEQCLESLSLQVPHVGYVHKHLLIVQSKINKYGLRAHRKSSQTDIPKLEENALKNFGNGTPSTEKDTVLPNKNVNKRTNPSSLSLS